MQAAERGSEERPAFLVMEGASGTGKTTVAASLRERSGATGFHFPPEFVRFREEVRLDEEVEGLPRMLYYLGAVAHLSDLVGAALDSSRRVLCDRYAAAPLSLLEAESAVDPDLLARLSGDVLATLRRPDLTLLLVADPEVAAARIQARAAAGATFTAVHRRSLDPAFVRRWTEALRAWSARLGPVAEIDTSRLTPEAMCLAAWEAARPLLARPGGPGRPG